MKILVVSPHRDDAAFSVGLTVDIWLEAGHRVEILCCFTRSEYAPYSDVDSLHPNDRLSYVTALRAREDAAWTKMYGGKLELRDLRLKDAPLRLRCSVDEVCALPVAPSEKIQRAIEKGLREVGAGALVLPLALGGHVDHRTAQALAMPAAAAGLPCAFYEDLPYAARPGAAEAIPDAAVTASLLLGEPLQPGFVAASRPGKAAARKRSLALQYDSQIDSEVVEQIAQFSERYGGRERLWANAAWQRTVGLALEALPQTSLPEVREDR